MRCPSARLPGPLARGFSDLDFATTAKERKSVTELLRGQGLAPSERFNAMQGHSRLLFVQPDGRHVDVFVDEFRLCHRLSFKDRLEEEADTIPLADLLLTKLQVAALTEKDLTDIVALLLDHELGADLDAQRVLDVLGGDWGWWRTCTETLTAVDDRIDDLPLPPADRLLARARTSELQGRIADGPRSRRWRMRAKVGEHRPWREDPDEVS